jgi:DNA-binding transcriptional LysR family regulator
MDGETKNERATLFQIRALAESLRRGDYAEAAKAMRIPDKHRVIRAAERAIENLGIEDAFGRVSDQPVAASAILKSADQLLDAFDSFLQTCRSVSGRPVVVRVLANPLMVAQFLGDAAAEIHAGTESATRIVILDAQEGLRRVKTSHVIAPLVAGHADIVIGPAPTFRTEASRFPAALRASGVSSRKLYDWKLTAAVASDHPLRSIAFRNDEGELVVDIQSLKGYGLALSPSGHFTRELVEHELGWDDSWSVEYESSSVPARVAFGRDVNVVPVIASDGALDYDTECWLSLVKRGRPTDSDSRGDRRLEPESERPIPMGGSQYAYFRSAMPGAIAAHVKQAVDAIVASAEHLRQRPGGTDKSCDLRWDRAPTRKNYQLPSAGAVSLTLHKRRHTVRVK